MFHERKNKQLSNKNSLLKDINDNNLLDSIPLTLTDVAQY